MAIDAKQLQAQGVYESRAPLASLLEDFDRIGKLLQEIAAIRKKFRLFATISAVAGIAIGIAAGILASNLVGFFAPLAFAFGVAIFVYSFVYGRKLHKHQDRLIAAQDLSKILRQDADLRSPFSVRLALSSPPKLIREEAWAARKNGQQRFFAEEFLSLQGELLDGTALTETVTELTRKRTYKNPRGRYKTKIRNRYLLALKFVYPIDLYGDARPASAALHEEIRVPPSAAVRDTRVTEKAIAVKALVQRKEDIIQTSAMLSMGAYRILNLARRSAPKAPGKAS
jgi:hypothetical protein